MSPRRTLGTLLALAVGGFGLAVTSAAVPAAHAVTGSPPVTTPDAVSVFQGGFAELQPVNNDHDPDNDQLAICRLGTEHYRGMQAIFIENDWAVFAKRKAKPGIYTFTYYACDFSYLTAGTITVTVEARAEDQGPEDRHQARTPPGHQSGRRQDPVPLRVVRGGQAGRQPDHRQGLHRS